MNAEIELIDLHTRVSRLEAQLEALYRHFGLNFGVYQSMLDEDGTIEFTIYLVAALLFIAALVLVLIRPLTWRGWLAGLAAGIIWLVVWYGPIPAWVGAALELFVIAGLIRAFRWTAPPKTVSTEPLPVEKQ